MIVEVDPGSGKGHVEDGAQLPARPDRTEHQPRRLPRHPRRRHPPVHPAAASPAAPRASAAAAAALQRLPPLPALRPLHRRSSTRPSPPRHVALAGVIHDFGLLTTELGRHDAEIERFVTSSKAALGNFANQQQSIQESLGRVPARRCAAAKPASPAPTRFSQAARPALIGLIPQAQALSPAFKATERFFNQTTAPIRDQIRPFTRADPAGADPRQAGRRSRSNKTVRGFGNSLGALQQLPQRARLQAEGLEAELPLLPALAQPRLQRRLQPPGRRRPDPARPGR